ncbi:hypothetical protein [uncultured Friedmanniella sp.]|uniref:hypothetical protein n=1 Tax=uncultured Friedmanniella sp. TaxID=335381 RepID=UPI0035C9681E
MTAGLASKSAAPHPGGAGVDEAGNVGSVRRGELVGDRGDLEGDAGSVGGPEQRGQHRRAQCPAAAGARPGGDVVLDVPGAGVTLMAMTASRSTVM